MPEVVTTGTVLDRIMAKTLSDVEIRQKELPLTELERKTTSSNRTPLDLKTAITGTNLGLIAEIKRASPSRGRFEVEIDPPVLAREYIECGASAISVLTDGPFFQGSITDLQQAKSISTSTPILRKDFILTEYQVYESLAIGADALLLIAAALTQQRLRLLHELANSLGLSVLLEVHDEAETERANEIGAQIIGINNRDLHDFSVDLATTERIAPLVRPDAALVAESGVFGIEECQRLAAAGANAVLIGEGLIMAKDRRSLIQQFTSVPVRSRR